RRSSSGSTSNARSTSGRASSARPTSSPSSLRAMTRYLLEVVRAVQLERPRMHLGGARVEIGGRRRFELEMAVTVDASNQVGGMALRAGVAHRGRNVADADADAPVTRAVGPGLM